MYAVIETGGKQYPVKEGDVLRIEKMDAEPGTAISMVRVLFYRDDQKTLIGKPVLENVKLQATILRHGKEKKIKVFTFKRRKRYERRKGHRQQFTEIKVDKIAVQ